MDWINLIKQLIELILTTTLDKELDLKKMYQIKEAIRQNRINKLWREPLSEYSTLEYPQWSPKTHTLFPLPMKNIIIQLSCYFNQEDTIFSILP